MAQVSAPHIDWRQEQDAGDAQSRSCPLLRPVPAPGVRPAEVFCDRWPQQSARIFGAAGFGADRMQHPALPATSCIIMTGWVSSPDARLLIDRQHAGEGRGGIRFALAIHDLRQRQTQPCAKEFPRGAESEAESGYRVGSCLFRAL